MNRAFTPLLTTPPGMSGHTRDCKQLYGAMSSFFSIFSKCFAHKQTAYK